MPSPGKSFWTAAPIMNSAKALGALGGGGPLMTGGGCGDDEGAVGRENRLHLVPGFPVEPRVLIGAFGGHQPLAARQRLRYLLVALDHHDLVGPELLVELPSVLLRERPHHDELNGG